MATKEEMLGILAGESGAMNRTVFGKKLGLPTSSFQHQLDRMEKQGLVERTEQHEYTITEAGRQYALAEASPEETPPPPGEETEETLKTTEYQQFVSMGQITGVVPMALISQTATHIWRGGDFRDLTWVWKGLTEMGIRPDLAQRWFHSWRSYLHQAVPSELALLIGTPQSAAEKEAAGKLEVSKKGKRDYILSGSDNPLYVGEGLGDLDYDDAVKLSTLRAAALVKGAIGAGGAGQAATPGSMADEVVKIFNAFKETMGPQTTKGKSYVVKPGDEGYTVEEIEEDKPIVVSPPRAGDTNPSPSFLITSDGEIQEVPAGRPVVIKQPPQGVPASPAKTLIIRQTPEGLKEEYVEAGKPIIISNPAPTSAPPMMLYPALDTTGQPVYDGDGKPVYANLEPMMKWMGFQSQQKRDEERHSALMGLVATVRENVGDGISALKVAADQAKGGIGSKPPTPQQQFRCECGTEFSPPPEWAGQSIKCPGCGHEYAKEELLG